MQTKLEKKQKLINTLLSADDAQHLKDNLQEIFLGYLSSSNANCKDERISKSYTYVHLKYFLNGLIKITNT